MKPIWQVSVLGEALSTVWTELAVALAITGGLLILTAVVARRMQNQMAAE